LTPRGGGSRKKGGRRELLSYNRGGGVFFFVELLENFQVPGGKKEEQGRCRGKKKGENAR